MPYLHPQASLIDTPAKRGKPGLDTTAVSFSYRPIVRIVLSSKQVHRSLKKILQIKLSVTIEVIAKTF